MTTPVRSEIPADERLRLGNRSRITTLGKASRSERLVRNYALGLKVLVPFVARQFGQPLADNLGPGVVPLGDSLTKFLQLFFHPFDL